MERRYGKSSASLLMQKTSFFEENEYHFKKQREIAGLYALQPTRTNCKNCDAKLSEPPDFVKDGIGYIICERCSHLNGEFEDTEKFRSKLYTENSGKEYAKNYKSTDLEEYNNRTASIYHPKVEYLCTSLRGLGVNPNSLSYLDFGTGSGYFVSALYNFGLSNIEGTEVSRSQVEYGNAMIGRDMLSLHLEEDSHRILSKTECHVVSMIGVLEHLQNPRQAIRELKMNKNVQFVFLSVPLFGLSVFLEILSPEVFHRQLHGGHTHLYTKKSLDYLFNEFGFEIVSEWWFGSDAVDLFRHVSVRLEKNDCTSAVSSMWRKKFTSLIDDIQLEVDKNHFSSEIHVLAKKK